MALNDSANGALNSLAGLLRSNNCIEYHTLNMSTSCSINESAAACNIFNSLKWII